MMQTRLVDQAFARDLSFGFRREAPLLYLSITHHVPVQYDGLPSGNQVR